MPSVPINHGILQRQQQSKAYSSKRASTSRKKRREQVMRKNAATIAKYMPSSNATAAAAASGGMEDMSWFTGGKQQGGEGVMESLFPGYSAQEEGHSPVGATGTASNEHSPSSSSSAAEGERLSISKEDLERFAESKGIFWYRRISREEKSGYEEEDVEDEVGVSDPTEDVLGYVNQWALLDHLSRKPDMVIDLKSPNEKEEEGVEEVSHAEATKMLGIEDSVPSAEKARHNNDAKSRKEESSERVYDEFGNMDQEEAAEAEDYDLDEWDSDLDEASMEDLLDLWGDSMLKDEYERERT